MIRRHALSEVRAALENSPVVLIHGPRQAGRSTLAQAATHQTGRAAITLDDPLPLGFAASDPSGFLKAHDGPLLIDEIQRAPGLFLPLKASVDRDRSPGRYLITGSANILTLPKISDSLAGRMAVVDLLPLSQSEMEGTPGGFVEALFEEQTACLAKPVQGEELAERIARGGFPEPASKATPSSRERWFADYIRTILERDVRDLANIEALTQLPRVLSLIAARAGDALNVVSLARDTGIPNTSLHRYLDLLRTVFLLQLVPAWSSDLGARLTKSPKAYVVDTGLLCYLDNLRPATLRSDSGELARPLENFVAMELRKLCSTGDLKPSLYHLRTVRQLQVDFVLEARGGNVVGIDLKPSASVTSDDADGLRFLRELAGKRFRRGVLLYLGDEIIPIERDIVAMPISALWRM